MILARSKIYLIAAALSLAACGTAKGVKVYYLDPPRGLVREQAKEVVSFPDAAGWLCENPIDFETTASCTAVSAKVYYVNWPKGLVRNQSSEVRSFESSKGFFCLTPQDFQHLVSSCNRISLMGN